MGQRTTGRKERGTARKTLYLWRWERRVRVYSRDAKFGVCRVWVWHSQQALDKTPPSLASAHTADSDTINAPICRTHVSYPIEQSKASSMLHHGW